MPGRSWEVDEGSGQVAVAKQGGGQGRGMVGKGRGRGRNSAEGAVGEGLSCWAGGEAKATS